MESTGTKRALEKSDNPVVLITAERDTARGSTSENPAEKKAIGYGLPCSHCHAYYPADMNICPVCKSPERVSPNQAVVYSTASGALLGAGAGIAGASVDEERERLLKELKSQVFASHNQINTPVTATFQCVLKHKHSGANDPAAVCHSCYSEVRQQADMMEGALQMDVKDAAKIVYEAVWADTSDPNATYLNAARALLLELHKRAGIELLAGEAKALSHC